MILFIIYLVVQRNQPRASFLLGKCSPANVYPSLCFLLAILKVSDGRTKMELSLAYFANRETPIISFSMTYSSPYHYAHFSVCSLQATVSSHL